MTISEDCTSVLEITDYIEFLYGERPDRRKKEYKIWYDEINQWVVKVNDLANFKLYAVLK